MIWINATFNIINFVLALVAIVLALGVTWRLAGKIALAYKFLVIAIAVFAVKEFIRFFTELQVFSAEILINVTKFVFIVLIIFSVLNIKRIIKEVDGHRNHKRRKK